MKSIKMFLFIIPVLLTGCKSYMQPPQQNIYLKRIAINTDRIDWYYRSLVTNDVPAFIAITHKDLSKDTICQADNICDINVYGKDTILILFNSYPQMYKEASLVKLKVKNYTIVVDTSCKRNVDSIKFANSYIDSSENTKSRYFK